jgi:hypothetical protein
MHRSVTKQGVITDAEIFIAVAGTAMPKSSSRLPVPTRILRSVAALVDNTLARTLDIRLPRW